MDEGRTHFIHLRYFPFANSCIPANNGGLTIGYRIVPYRDNPDYKVCKFAVAHCNLKDNFNRKIGRRIVVGRLDGDDHYQFCFQGEVVPYEAMKRRALINAACVSGDDPRVGQLC